MAQLSLEVPLSNYITAFLNATQQHHLIIAITNAYKPIFFWSNFVKMSSMKKAYFIDVNWLFISFILMLLEAMSGAF